MKQVIRKGLKEMLVDEVPDPEVKPHHVLVRPVYSLISSGTETASIHQEGVLRAVGENPSQLLKLWDIAKVQGPLRMLREASAKLSEYAVLGYSGAGVVVETHPSVRELAIGDRVAYGGEGTGHGECLLVGQNLAARMPETVSYRDACFATLGSIAMNAVRQANIGVGDIVAVVGLGLVGQLVSQVVRCQGGVVVTTDLRPERLSLAKELGAEHGFSAGEGLREAIASITGGRGADCVIIAAAAKSAAPCQQALEICRDRGTIVVVGAVEMVFPWYEMYVKEIRLFMARAYGPGSYDPLYEKQGVDYPVSYIRWTEKRNMEEFLHLIRKGAVRVEPLITHEYSLEEATKAYETILDRTSGSLAVVLRYPAAESRDPAREYVPQRTVFVAPRGDSRAALGVALVGAGNIAKWEHLPALGRVPGVRLDLICSASGARGKSYALRFGAQACTSSFDEVLASPTVDVVLIASRNHEHASQALAALRAGKHVFVEKPMALTLEECRALIGAVRESGKILTVGFNRRFSPDYREFREQMQKRSGPAVFQARVNSPGISGAYWMADPAIGGAILGEACHFVDLLSWLAAAEPVSVFAHALPTGSKEPIGENNVTSSFRFADGSIANLTYCTIGSRTSGGERVEAFAQGLGVATEDFKRLTVSARVRRNRSRWFAAKGYEDQLASFIEAIRLGREPEVTVLDGARATVGCLGILESAKCGVPVALDLAALEE